MEFILMLLMCIVSIAIGFKISNMAILLMIIQLKRRIKTLEKKLERRGL